MLKLLSKAVLSSGLLTGTFLVNFSTVESPSLVTSDNNNFRKIKQQAPTQITKIEDIKLFEKAHNCSFAFVKAWGNKELYNAEEFIKKEKTPGKDWIQEVIKGANDDNAKNSCKEGKSVTLFFGNNDHGFVSNDYAKFRQ